MGNILKIVYEFFSNCILMEVLNNKNYVLAEIMDYQL